MRAVVAGETESREVVLDATNRRGKAIRCRVTCMPLLGLGKEIHGGILLMEEWDARRLNEAGRDVE